MLALVAGTRSLRPFAPPPLAALHGTWQLSQTCLLNTFVFTAQQVWKVIKNVDQATTVNVVPDLVWYCESEGTKRPASHAELRSSVVSHSSSPRPVVSHIHSASSVNHALPKAEAEAITAGAVDVPPPDESMLPDYVEKHLDEASGRHFYYNSHSGETVWHLSEAISSFTKPERGESAPVVVKSTDLLKERATFQL